MAGQEKSRYLARGTDYFRYQDHATFIPGPVTPPPTSSGSYYIGASMADWDALNTRCKSGGKRQMGIRRSYDNNMPNTFAGSIASGDPGRGCASYWSWSDTTQIPTVASGSMNAQITGFLNSIPAGHTFYGTFWHEVDLHYTNYATYKSAWAQIRAAYNASSCNKSIVKLGGLLTQSGFRSGAGSSYFDSNHDFVGIDWYDFWRPPGSPPDPKTGNLASTHPPSYYMDTCVSLATSLGVPIIIGENGYHPFNTSTDVLPPTDTSSKPYRMNATISYLDGLSIGVLAYCYFNSGAGGSGPWWLDSFPVWTSTNTQNYDDPDSLTAFQTIISTHSAYKGS